MLRWDCLPACLTQGRAGRVSSTVHEQKKNTRSLVTHIKISFLVNRKNQQGTLYKVPMPET